MEKIHQLRGIIEFVAAAQGGSFSAAARDLGVSVAHVSRAVRDLEHEIGVQLILRDTRKSALTEAGGVFFEQCRTMLDELSEARERLKTGGHAVRGAIRISMGGYYAESRIALALADFGTLHPDVSIEVESSSRNVDLVEEGFDLAIRAGPLESSGLIARRLVGFPIVTLAAPALLARVGVPTHPRLLDPSLCLPLGSRSWSFRQAGEDYGLRPAGMFRSNGGAPLVTACVAARGFIRLPAYYGVEELAAASLVPVLSDWGDPQGEFVFHIVYPAQRHLPVRTRMLIDHLINQHKLQRDRSSSFP